MVIGDLMSMDNVCCVVNYIYIYISKHRWKCSGVNNFTYEALLTSKKEKKSSDDDNN